MKERGILFGPPMVKALLRDVDPKTQTRRAWPDQPPPGVHVGFVPGQSTTPYGVVGDRLWVREAWRSAASLNKLSGTGIADACFTAGFSKPWAPIVYEADGARNDGWTGFGNGREPATPGRYRHARFMPRWASRITLEITDVRIERLLDVSEEDAVAEGCFMFGGQWRYSDDSTEGFLSARDCYLALWEVINGAGSSGADPWVWRIAFKRVPKIKLRTEAT